MDIVVLVKGVPDFSEGNIEFKEDNTLDRGSTSTILNPNDHHALECARELKVKHGGTIHVVSMGPPNYKEVLAEALEIAGDQTYLLSDGKLAGADTWATAHALMAGIQQIGDPDVVIAGFKTADGETGQTGPQTSLLLDLPIVTHVTELTAHPEEETFEAKRVLYNEVELCEGPLPAFIVMDPDYQASFTRASERLKLKDIESEQAEKVEDHEDLLSTWDVDALGIDQWKVGLKGSPTIVRSVDPIPQPPAERDATFYDGDSMDDLEEVARIIVERGDL